MSARSRGRSEKSQKRTDTHEARARAGADDRTRARGRPAHGNPLPPQRDADAPVRGEPDVAAHRDTTRGEVGRSGRAAGGRPARDESAASGREPARSRAPANVYLYGIVRWPVPGELRSSDATGVAEPARP